MVVIVRGRSSPGRSGGGQFGGFLAVGAVFDDETDGFFDAHPVIFFRNRRRCLVDPAMLPLVHCPCDLVLPLRIRHHFFILQHKPLHPSLLLGWRKLVVRRRASKPAFLCSVRAVGVFGVLEVESDFVKALFGDEVFAFRAEVAAIDDGVDEGVGVGA